LTEGRAANGSVTQSLDYYTKYRFPSQCVGPCGANATSSPFMGLAALSCGRPGDQIASRAPHNKNITLGNQKHKKRSKMENEKTKREFVNLSCGRPGDGRPTNPMGTMEVRHSGVSHAFQVV